jgi:UDP:flavonoid glycosyltransferase YjiC (YdhE family)
VLLPLFSFDQFVNADRVADVGVGIALIDDTPGEPRAGDLVPHGPFATEGLAEAVGTVLGQRGFSDRAREIALEIERLPIIDACVVDALDALVG